MPDTTKAREILQNWLDSHKNIDSTDAESIQRAIRRLEAYQQIQLPFANIDISKPEPFQHEYTIWSNEHSGSDYNCAVIAQALDEEIWAETSEQEIRDQAAQANENWRQDEMVNLSEPTHHDGALILMLKSRQLWDGYYLSLTCEEYKSPGQILEAGYQETSIFYGDGNNIFCDDIHHDGTNVTLFRIAKDMPSYLKIADAIDKYSVESWDKRNNTLFENLPGNIQKIIQDNSESLWPYVAKTYGWPI